MVIALGTEPFAFRYFFYFRIQTTHMDLIRTIISIAEKNPFFVFRSSADGAFGDAHNGYRRIGWKGRRRGRRRIRIIRRRE